MGGRYDLGIISGLLGCPRITNVVALIQYKKLNQINIPNNVSEIRWCPIIG
jgi:hypothetical protein